MTVRLTIVAFADFRSVGWRAGVAQPDAGNAGRTGKAEKAETKTPRPKLFLLVIIFYNLLKVFHLE